MSDHAEWKKCCKKGPEKCCDPCTDLATRVDNLSGKVDKLACIFIQAFGKVANNHHGQGENDSLKGLLENALYLLEGQKGEKQIVDAGTSHPAKAFSKVAEHPSDHSDAVNESSDCHQSPKHHGNRERHKCCNKASPGQFPMDDKLPSQGILEIGKKHQEASDALLHQVSSLYVLARTLGL